jgi:ribonuclease D
MGLQFDVLPMNNRPPTTPLTHESINQLPLLNWGGEIIEIITPQGAHKALEIISKEKVVGFDTETRPSYTKGVVFTPALLQVATSTQAFIFRLKYYPSPDELISFLESDSILKVGVGIQDDINGLKKIFHFNPQGFVDLSKIAREQGHKEGSLRALCAIYLEARLSKAAKLTNWERRDLTESQIQYAATDAAVGLMIYEKMMKS